MSESEVKVGILAEKMCILKCCVCGENPHWSVVVSREDLTECTK